MTIRKNNVLSDSVFLIFLSSAFLLIQLGYGSLASWDEALYATSAKELLNSSHWMNLTYGGIPWSDKPPLYMWVTAVFYKFFGVNEFSARLFSALAGIGTVVITYLFGSRLFSRWIGLLSALVLLSSSHFIHYARFGQLDSALTFFITASLYFFWMGREKNRFFIYSGTALGLAVMTKGFAGFFIVFICWIYCLGARETNLLGRPNYWIGLMIAAAIALPWHLHEMIFNSNAFMTDVIKKHLIERTTTPLEGHVGNYYFYIRTMVNKFHPWILIGVLSGPYFLFKSIKTRYEEFVFPTVWMFFIFGVVTLVATKLPWYIIPAYPALSISVGFILAKFLREENQKWVMIAFAVGMILHVPYSHIFDHDYSRDIKALSPIVQNQVPDSAVLYMYDYHDMPAAHFYTGRPNGKIEYVDERADFVKRVNQSKEFYCLIRDERLNEIKPDLKDPSLKVISSQKGLSLIFAG